MYFKLSATGPTMGSTDDESEPMQLTEDDIEGASLAGREPKQLTVQQLKFWLSCRGIKASKLKTKAEVVIKYV